MHGRLLAHIITEVFTSKVKNPPEYRIGGYIRGCNRAIKINLCYLEHFAGILILTLNAYNFRVLQPPTENAKLETPRTYGIWDQCKIKCQIPPACPMGWGVVGQYIDRCIRSKRIM